MSVLQLFLPPTVILYYRIPFVLQKISSLLEDARGRSMEAGGVDYERALIINLPPFGHQALWCHFKGR